MHQQIVQPLSPWGNHQNQPCKFFQNIKHLHKKPILLRATSGSIIKVYKNELNANEKINYKPHTSSKQRNKTRVISIVNKKSSDMLNFKGEIQKNSDTSYIKNKSIGFKCKTIEYQKPQKMQIPTSRSHLRRQFITHQVKINGTEQIPLPYRLRALGQAPSRIFNKKQSDETAFKYSSRNSSAKPKTAALCKRLNQMLRKGNDQKIEKVLKFETFRSKIFNQQVQSHRNLNASQKKQRGTMLSKYSHKTFLTFRNNQQEQTTDSFLINNRRVSIIKTQKKHLLDRLLMKYE